MGQHGGSIIGKRLQAHGIRQLFTLCGGHISPILVGAEEHGVQVVDVRDEASAVFAADAVARMTGIPGVAAVTAGPGVTNTITAVKNAQMAESPLLVFGGATATILKGRGSLQDIDQMSIMRPITKFCASVKTVQALGPLVDHALRVAKSGIPGPVFLEVPVDLLYPEATVKEWYLAESGVDRMKGPAKTAVELALKAYIARIFHAPHVPFERLPDRGDVQHVLRSSLQSQKIMTAAQALRAARKPVLVVGSQTLANMSPSRALQLADAIRSLGIPTFLGGTARGLLGHEDPLQFRHKRSKALRDADVVLVAGFPFDFRMGYGQKINKKATLIAANLDPVALRKNRRPDLALLTHPGDFLIELSKQADTSRTKWTSWFGELREREQERDDEILAQSDPAPELVNPMHFFQRMEEVMANDSVLVVDGGDFVATGAYILRPRSPLSWLDPGVFGTLGVGGGFALGAALSRPNAEVWIVWGDGSSGYSLAEFDTYVRHGLAPIGVIGTDASWAQIARDQVDILGTPLGTELLRTDYHEVARGYGGEGILVTSDDEVVDALARAKELSAQGKPVVINLHLAGSDFRKGSLSI